METKQRIVFSGGKKALPGPTAQDFMAISAKSALLLIPLNSKVQEIKRLAWTYSLNLYFYGQLKGFAPFYLKPYVYIFHVTIY